MAEGLEKAGLVKGDSWNVAQPAVCSNRRYRFSPRKSAWKSRKFVSQPTPSARQEKWREGAPTSGKNAFLALTYPDLAEWVETFLLHHF
jgi:hypothetical protein